MPFVRFLSSLRAVTPAAGLLLSIPCRAFGQQPTGEAKLVVPSLEEETRLALSAAPDHLRDGAGVYALTPDGFKQVRESTNGFTCVVNRDHPLALKPTCYDAEGTRTILPKVVFVGEQLLRGASLDEIKRQVTAKFASGEFTSPARAGVAYMLSKEIRNVNPQTGAISGFPPHVMFYAPNVTNADIGTTREAARATRWLPFVAYQGPQGFIIVVVP